MSGKSKKPHFSNEVGTYFKEYCNSTSIHGFRYFGEDRSIFERIWWMIIFSLCLSGCFIMIYKIYEKYDSSPVIVTFATKETPIYKIPFPAITICPETKSVRKLFNFTEVRDKKANGVKTTPQEDTYFDYMSLICDDDFDLFDASGNETFLAMDFYNTIDKIKPSFFNFASDCEFMGYPHDCEDIMVPIFTDEGVCYSFNILDRHEIFKDTVVHHKDFHKAQNKTSWSMENGYLPGSEAESYPRRALLPGATNGFSINLVTSKEDIDYGCKGVQGYRVLLHTPGRIPRLKQEYFRIPLGQAVITAIQPTMITTSGAVKSYSIEKRECCFPSERSLRFFKTYSQLNCQLECLTNFTVASCGCADIYMPRDNNTKICGVGNYFCLKFAEKILLTDGIFSKIQSNSNNPNVEMLDCDCMPLCSDLSYNTETSQTNINTKNVESKTKHQSSFTVYFKVNHFITSERNELYGPTDFLANFGGVLGLFTGFSILSMMEIIYFLTIRICCNIKLYRRWFGREENT